MLQVDEGVVHVLEPLDDLPGDDPADGTPLQPVNALILA